MAVLEVLGELGLADLALVARDAAARPLARVEVADELHRQRRAALDVAAFDVLDRGAQDALEVDALVLEEAAVLDRDGRLPGDGRDVLLGDRHAQRRAGDEAQPRAVVGVDRGGGAEVDRLARVERRARRRDVHDPAHRGDRADGEPGDGEAQEHEEHPGGAATRRTAASLSSEAGHAGSGDGRGFAAPGGPPCSGRVHPGARHPGRPQRGAARPRAGRPRGAGARAGRRARRRPAARSPPDSATPATRADVTSLDGPDRAAARRPRRPSARGTPSPRARRWASGSSRCAAWTAPSRSFGTTMRASLAAAQPRVGQRDVLDDAGLSVDRDDVAEAQRLGDGQDDAGDGVGQDLPRGEADDRGDDGGGGEDACRPAGAGRRTGPRPGSARRARGPRR